MKIKTEPMPILLAGPLPIKGDLIGGTKVSFEILAKALECSEEFNPIIHNTSRKLLRASKLKRLLLNLSGLITLCLFLLFNRVKSNHFMWNVSANGLMSSGVLIWIITKLLRYRVILRVFGGDLAEVLSKQSAFKKVIFGRTFMSFNFILVQSKSLVSELDSYRNVHWFPTTRTFKSNVQAKQKHCSNFIYVGQLKLEKGLDLICEILERNESECFNITICGPEVSIGLSNRLKACGANVLGQVPFEKVQKHIADADVFIFPTRYVGEGYPGAVIEALQLGVPVITTDWKYMTEIVEDRKSGLIIESTFESLLDAMLELKTNQTLFSHLSEGAISRGNEFNTTTALTRLKNLINE